MTGVPADRSWPARVDGVPVALTVTDTALLVGDLAMPHTELDEVHLDGPNVRLVPADAPAVTVTHLARGHDAFLAAFVPARAAARRAALLQWTGDAAIDAYDGRRDGQTVALHLFPDGVTVEPWAGRPGAVPFPCLDDVERSGYDLTFRARGLDPVAAGRYGNRTDELLADLDRARAAHSARTRAAYAALDPDLGGWPAADGWALDEAGAGARWPTMRRAIEARDGGGTLAVLAERAGAGLRLGVKLEARGTTMPFALAARGGRVAVESFGDEARATYVFAVDDVERLNAVLLVTSFRREALYLPEERLGRWRLAVRLLPVVREARGALVARIVHDDRWAANVATALP